jgi:hypothetical protein
VLAGGLFTLAGGSPNGHFAQWGSSCASPDLNGDGAVNVHDLLSLIGMWGACTSCSADLNSDNVVNVLDLLLLIASWG